MKTTILAITLCLCCVFQISAASRIEEPNSSTSEVEYGVKCLQRICPTVMWDSWTFRDVICDNDTKTVMFIVQLKSWHEKDAVKEITKEDALKETEWIVSNFKAGYQELTVSSQIMCDGDWMLYLSVGQLLKKMEKDGYSLRIMLLKPDYLNQACGDIPLELTSEQLKKVEAK